MRPRSKALVFVGCAVFGVATLIEISLFVATVYSTLLTR